MTGKTTDDHLEDEQYMRQLLLQVYDALQEKGYDPINQIVGYIISEDPTYITSHKNARSLIGKINCNALVRVLIKNYLEG